MKQPEALRLADLLDAAPYSSACTHESANELRRQHALIAELTEALAWYVAEDDVIEYMPGNEFWVAGKRRAQAVIAKSEAQQ